MVVLLFYCRDEESTEIFFGGVVGLKTNNVAPFSVSQVVVGCASLG